MLVITALLTVFGASGSNGSAVLDCSWVEPTDRLVLLVAATLIHPVDRTAVAFTWLAQRVAVVLISVVRGPARVDQLLQEADLH